MTPYDTTEPVQAHRIDLADAVPSRPARVHPKKDVPHVQEAAFVRAIAGWLKGETWPYDRAAFRPYRGLSVRLIQVDDELHSEGVAVITRDPPSLMRLPTGTKTTARTEARALCAVALRGDLDMYP